MEIPDSLKVTNDILLQGDFIFAIMDVVYIAILNKLIKQEDLIKMKWELVIHLGILDKPPMLIGSSPIAALP